MTRKTALYALAVVVLMGSLAGVALAEHQGMNEYGPADSSVSSSSEPMQNAEPSAAGEIREPMETGAVPDRSGSSGEIGSGTGDAPTVEFGGRTYRPEIDLGS